MFDCRRTLDELEAVTGVSWSSCQRILTEELHMKRVAAKFVPRLLLEDQRAAHTALSVWQFLTKNGMTTVPHPPYSLDLAPSIFFCFQE